MWRYKFLEHIVLTNVLGTYATGGGRQQNQVGKWKHLAACTTSWSWSTFVQKQKPPQHQQPQETWRQLCHKFSFLPGTSSAGTVGTCRTMVRTRQRIPVPNETKIATLLKEQHHNISQLLYIYIIYIYIWSSPSQPQPSNPVVTRFKRRFGTSNISRWSGISYYLRSENARFPVLRVFCPFTKMSHW